ncbi:regulatory protein RecX [Reinekea thalattae]|uniref:Regulatory protein RecX n=1 Tax=Reinekea thalattae TaxID=2593301 RepID=A0A5C8Z7X5_9GAMM|nr:regulatory protein RecX [Reinekea thalattae]TXR54052.1 regulatory protein RecX [Reinekea thalattae]
MSIWNSALNTLAKREYSQSELRTKLQTRFPEQLEEIEQVLERLVEQGLQSDQRFAEMWLNSQVEKGRGPIRISYEARNKGIASLIQGLLEQSEINWFEHARDCALRKFSSLPDQRAYARAYRYLSYRGFNGEMVRYAISAIETNSQQLDAD